MHIIIFSGYNQRAVIAFLRTLKQCGVTPSIIAKSHNDPIFKTSYRNQVKAVRTKEALVKKDIIFCIQKIKKQTGHSQFLVAPSTEALNRHFLDNMSFYKLYSIEIPLVNHDLYIEISDKKSFSKLCQSNNIKIPVEHFDLNNTSLPIVAKPIKYLNDDGKAFKPILIYNKNDLIKFKTNYPQNSFYYQELVIGQSYYLLYYFSRDGQVYKFSQKNVAQQTEGKSIVAALPSKIHGDPISTQYENLFCSIGFHGLVMVEIIKDTKKNEYYMIEANPRFWGPSQLFVDNNTNFFEFLLYDYGLLKKEPTIGSTNMLMSYYWQGGVSLAKKEGADIVVHSPLDMDKNCIEWEKNDVYNRQDTNELFKEELGHAN
ncbi:hypothetical protein [Vreelandella populi]|uniref:ATP-grasp domain-containing protein n=1 Tax=Vreelandella populi TaxID=2498858 RepID=A0A433L8K0_9GAMM|nr:hypothetical protein [Halomonas populi]RUR40113.1 hypothetical protein ELY25_04735 [Halomonas populi]RUR43983.1 hypothetical protein ELY37_16370 [Halomonas populi]